MQITIFDTLDYSEDLDEFEDFKENSPPIKSNRKSTKMDKKPTESDRYTDGILE